MKSLVIIGALLAAGVSTQALSEPASDLPSRYMRACTADGDSEAYCRCELKVVRGTMSEQELGQALTFTEADEATQKTIATQMGQEAVERLFSTLEKLSKEAEASCRPANPRPAPR